MAEFEVEKIIPNRLYQFPEAFGVLDTMLHDSEGEMTPEIESYWTTLNASLEEKARNTVMMVFERLAFAEAKRKAAADLIQEADTMERTALNLTKYLGAAIDGAGKDGLETPVGIIVCEHEEGELFTTIQPVNNAHRIDLKPKTEWEDEVSIRVEAFKEREIVFSARATELDRLKTDQEADKEFIEGQKDYISDEMGKLGQVKMRAGRWIVSRQKNGNPSAFLDGVVMKDSEGKEITMEGLVPNEYLKFPEPPKPGIDYKGVVLEWRASADNPPDLFTVWEAPEEKVKELEAAGRRVKADPKDEEFKPVRVVVKRGYHIRTK